MPGPAKPTPASDLLDVASNSLNSLETRLIRWYATLCREVVSFAPRSHEIDSHGVERRRRVQADLARELARSGPVTTNGLVFAVSPDGRIKVRIELSIDADTRLIDEETS